MQKGIAMQSINQLTQSPHPRDARARAGRMLRRDAGGGHRLLANGSDAVGGHIRVAAADRRHRFARRGRSGSHRLFRRSSHNLKQLFAGGQEFTYSIEDIARYYRSHLELRRRWDAVVPGWVLRVGYEDLVQDLEAHVRRILEFCGLQFEPACIEFYNTERSERRSRLHWDRRNPPVIE
jgi:hypothetical protein